MVIMMRFLLRWHFTNDHRSRREHEGGGGGAGSLGIQRATGEKFYAGGICDVCVGGR